MKNLKQTQQVLFYFIFFLALTACQDPTGKEQENVKIHVQPLLVGEVTQNTAVLQARTTKTDSLVDEYDVPGKAGIGRFEISTDQDFNQCKQTKWMKSEKENDFIIKEQVTDLEPGKKYYYRLAYGLDTNNTFYSTAGHFKTLPSSSAKEEISFAMVTGMHHYRFWKGNIEKRGVPAPSSKDSILGFPAYESLEEINPDYFIGNGDNVYYDHRPNGANTQKDSLRAHWHRLYSMPRLRSFLLTTGTYWLKDDHDFRYDDADTTNYNKPDEYIPLPTVETGIQLFLEQTPIHDPKEDDKKTYRTLRMGKDLQIWILENRDYRSPNTMKDSPEKSIWGPEQKKWLKKTLLESDATYKLLISPTPMIGPDDTHKIDNHCNTGGFRHERDSFFNWVKKHNLHQEDFYILCGDRHWKYHSILDGIEEFSCGALVDGNSRIGVKPGEGTDPEALIEQPYTDQKPTGGFLITTLKYDQDEPYLHLQWFDEKGKQLYEVKK